MQLVCMVVCAVILMNILLHRWVEHEMLDLISAFFSEEDAERFKVKRVGECVWVVDGPGGTFYLKRRMEMDLEEKITTYLHRCSIMAELPHPTRQGGFITWSGECGYALYACIPGIRPGWDASNMSAIGTYLANLHAVFMHFPSERVKTWDISLHTMEWIQQCSHSPAIDWARSLMIPFCSQDLEGGKQLVHGDVHPGNLLIDKEGEVGIIDFHRLRVAHRMADAAYFCTHLIIHNGISLPLITAFLKGYGAESPFKEGEVAQFMHHLTMFIIQYAFYLGQADDPFASLSQLTAVSEAVHDLMSPPRNT
ncbi:phosphotransferase enzyme family protein [Rossellomorea sp. FS2]